MTLTAVESKLSKNLAALGMRNAELADLLPLAMPCEHLCFGETADGVITATIDGKQLCSRHQPLDEAQRQIEGVDLVEHAVVVVMGFGLGYHVQKLAERSQKATLIVVFEPNVSLLRDVFDQIDHSHWLGSALVLFVTDADDRGSLARKLDGAESILAQGVHFFEHPASKQRLGNSAGRFGKLFSDFMASAKTTLTTTLMRSADTIRNLILNVDHYAGGAGVRDLSNVAKGMPAVVVSAGPSLHRNLRELKRDGVRERCVIIAVQTALKPLLDAGIQPHFVTALDYHEISKRFYEDLNPEDLQAVTLVADPKANPVILDVYPGPVRCCANDFLDKLLGPIARDMGKLPAGATVAHLAMYLARYMGCDPIAIIGQDLGFSDGLYYAPGTAIHQVWAPELNPFNTIAMMEWQRIARHRTHLKKVKDVHGKNMYTDAQMHAYLQQFERDFAKYKSEGLTIIDASEGGVAKQHTTTMLLRDFLAKHATRALPSLPSACRGTDAQRIQAARTRVGEIRSDIQRLSRTSDDTASLLRKMIDHQGDGPKMAGYFKQLESHRKQVDQRFAAFELINQLNQLGVFKRLKADRRMHMESGRDPLSKQRAQLERDLENVKWIADAARQMLEQLVAGDRILAGESLNGSALDVNDVNDNAAENKQRLPSKIAALIAIDPVDFPFEQSEVFGNQSALQCTLEKLGQSTAIELIILIAPRAAGVDQLIDRSRLALPLIVEVSEDSPFGPEHVAVLSARKWADTCWRGGIAGMSIYDEVLCPKIMSDAMAKHGLSAALVVGAQWPAIDISICDAVVRRHLENPAQHSLVFTQAPPGLAGCVVSATLMKELSGRSRLSTVGGILVYQPHAPQHDPIARDANVQIDHRVRHSLIRATHDSHSQHDCLERAIQSKPATDFRRWSANDWVQAIEATAACKPAFLPRHITLELCTARTSSSIFQRSFGPIEARSPVSLEAADRILHEIGKWPEILITLGGAGDPLLHPHFDDVIRMAKSAGAKGIHVRSELLCDQSVLDRLLACNVDVISIDLNADRAATFETMMGLDRFKDVIMNIDYLLQHRQRLSEHAGTMCFAIPWIVPRLQRRAETYEDIDSFFDRWQHMLGTAVIDDPPRKLDGSLWLPDALTPAFTPARVAERDSRRSMTILCNGAVTDEWNDFTGARCVGTATGQRLANLWHKLTDSFDRKSA
jgi:hypothetical protein